MPPRRSSRSTRASVEPTMAESLPAKRKRTQVVVVDSDIEEIEPPPRTRRSTSARPSAATSKGRTSTRSRGSLPDVAETDEQSDSPPVKKARPSLDTKEEDSDFEEEKPKARRVARGKPPVPVRPSSSRSGRSTRASAVPEPIVDEEDQGVDEEDVKPARRGAQNHSGKAQPSTSYRRASTEDAMIASDDEPKSTNRKSKVGKSTASKKQPIPIHTIEDSDEEEEKVQQEEVQEEEGEAVEEEEEDLKPARRGGRPTKAQARMSSQPISVKDEDATMLSSDDEPQPIRRKPKAKNLASRKGSGPEGSGASDEIGTIQPDAKEVRNGDDEPAEEEETSLFEPPPMPAPSLPQAMPEEPAGPKSRLVIHKMALINFKSYAGRQEIGPFHKSFSSIVGPNGSGKSNTIDALLFVFGYRASKMRQGKLSELIHNSARYPDLDECSVEVHFRDIIDLPGPEDYEVVPDSQLIVTRQAFKNNSSRYTINGRSSTYTEVQALLKGRGIDLDHNRFLILQGEVESIAQMKPKAATEHDDGLLEYLEDIIGTSRFKEPIDEAMVEMERLQDERIVKLNRLRIVEKEKSALEKEKKEAENYLRLKNDHVRAQSRLWQWILWRCFINEEEFEAKIAKYKKDLQDETNRNQDDITHLELLRKHYEEREKAYDEVRAAAEEAVKDLTAHEKQEVGLQERRKHAASKAKKLKKSLQDDTNAKAKALRDITDNSERIEREKGKADKFESDLVTEEKVLEGIRDSLKDKTQGFHDQIEVKQKELQPWTAKINAKQAEIDVASSERDALAKKAEALEAARKDAVGTLDNLNSDHGVKLREHEKLKDNKTNLQRQMAAAERTAQECQKKVDEWRVKASSSRQKVDEAKASQADNRSQGKVLDSLTRLQATGRIQGFHGRLGSLGTIPDKFDVAVSTATPSLHNMVVDKVDQGQACIEYLRTQNVGRASFLVLEKLRSNDGMAKINTPENVPRLFDLVKPKDPKFAPAFYKAMGNTLVAEDMDQANRIAFGGARRWRVVTLAGGLIETSGVMTGGGTQPARGGMSSKLAAEAVQPEVLRSYEQESQDASRKLEEALGALRQAEEELEKLKTSGPQIEMAYQKLGLDIENSKRRIADAEKRVQEVRSQSKPNAGDLSRISTLDAEIASSTEELKELQTKSGKIENAIKDLEKKILDIGGARLLTQKSKVDGIKLHITLANDEITKAEVAKAKAEKDSVKLDSSIKSNTTAVEDVDTELKELNGQLEQLETYVTELRTKVEAAQTAAENSKEDLDELKTELDAKDQEIEAFRRKEMEIKQALSDVQKEAKENGRLIDHWRNEHDQLQLEEIDDEDDEDDEGEGEGATMPAESEQAEQAENGSQDIVKSEPGGAPPSKSKAKHKTPSNELHTYSADELAKLKKRELVADVELLDESLKRAKPDLSVLKEYRKREEEFLNRAKDLDTITSQRDAQKQKYDGLRKQRLDEFMAGFNLISLKLKEMYQMITLGGNAELELVDSMDPFSEGIIFSVMPPKKSWKNISNLSGGEKTLSSLALVFALHVFKPTPLYFMDEIDAALDFRNVSIVANYIKDRTKNAQFIIISLRNDMFELSHRLIGIYKTANATRSISIDNHALIVVPPSAA
ncbi:Structural maintenance of chromosomes protein 4 [Hypsizygus marmoreus]|uniref:Structural maintenance of chromosomes protein 4 n=1 Tax=Hypsizygus marmoreus TaxID=39966 RepID=A0A369JIY8_HYPMA|nr:Structural maintenance of chromosomes protein 4 [Hypsizygus marmoreus]